MYYTVLEQVYRTYMYKFMEQIFSPQKCCLPLPSSLCTQKMISLNFINTLKVEVEHWSLPQASLSSVDRCPCDWSQWRRTQAAACSCGKQPYPRPTTTTQWLLPRPVSWASSGSGTRPRPTPPPRWCHLGSGCSGDPGREDGHCRGCGTGRGAAPVCHWVVLPHIRAWQWRRGGPWLASASLGVDGWRGIRTAEGLVCSGSGTGWCLWRKKKELNTTWLQKW